MISNDKELLATQERIAFFCRTLAQMRVTAAPGEYKLYSNSYLVELEKMNAEVLEYLKRHTSEVKSAEAA